jgi:isopenicillin N synthase-like dioxygenase
VLEYWRACLALARRLVRIFALALDLPEDYFDEKTSHPDAAVALNFYPTIPESALAPGLQEAVSIGSHTDLQFFTMLWQDQNGGLQVLTREGQWLNAMPIEGTFVVNIGDYLQRITNDRFISTVHRAKNFKTTERFSMPFFFGRSLRLCAVKSEG